MLKRITGFAMAAVFAISLIFSAEIKSDAAGVYLKAIYFSDYELGGQVRIESTEPTSDSRDIDLPFGTLVGANGTFNGKLVTNGRYISIEKSKDSNCVIDGNTKMYLNDKLLKVRVISGTTFESLGYADPKAGSSGNTIDAKTKAINDARAVLYKGFAIRLYDAKSKSGDHVYTANINEAENLINNGWNHETRSDGKNSFRVSQKKTAEFSKPVYCAYNPNAGGFHLYTNGKGEVDSLVKKGWVDIYGGVPVYYVSGNSGKNGIYRAYNPNSRNGQQHYCIKSEYDALIKKGWRPNNYGNAFWYTDSVSLIEELKPFVMTAEERKRLSDLGYFEPSKMPEDQRQWLISQGQNPDDFIEGSPDIGKSWNEIAHGKWYTDGTYELGRYDNSNYYDTEYRDMVVSFLIRNGLDR